MNYLSFLFLSFLFVFAVAYYIVRPKYRYIVLFFGSYFFYGYANVKLLFVLGLVTLLSFASGFLLERKKDKSIFLIVFLFNMFPLIVYKYTGFFFSTFNRVSTYLSGSSLSTNWDIVTPVGISFIVFQACTYLSDVYRGRISVEKNIIRYASFVAFFPTVLSGPIQKARMLLPQIKEPKGFEYEQAKKATLLFVWGAFEKLLVANRLKELYTNIIYDYSSRSSAEILIGAVSFPLYIYADFSAYSDMARGIAKLLGIEVGRNFSNPYLSQNTTEFWTRWHMSLNSWFVENLYIPLGGSRKGFIRKNINIIIVFLLSGLWHGANWHFVVWGGINGILVIVGQILIPARKKIEERIGVSYEMESIVFLRRLVVFMLITFTWLFFATGTLDALHIIKRIVLFDYISLFNPELLSVQGDIVRTFITMISTAVFCKIQLARQSESGCFLFYKRQPLLVQCISMSVVIVICLFAAYSTDASVDTQFLYFQF